MWNIFRNLLIWWSVNDKLAPLSIEGEVSSCGSFSEEKKGSIEKMFLQSSSQLVEWSVDKLRVLTSNDSHPAHLSGSEGVGQVFYLVERFFENKELMDT